MSVWFSQTLSIIGRPGTKDLSKVLRIPVSPYSPRVITVSGGEKNHPPFPCEAMSKGFPNLIFALSTMVECESHYRSLYMNGKHIEVHSLGFCGQETLEAIESHRDWIYTLDYEDLLKKFQAKFSPGEGAVSRIPITEETEIGISEDG